jgi:DNA repair photolyase
MRDVANVVRDNGIEGLTEAERRSDQARYQIVRCRSALNRVEGMPFKWTLNPYRGCTHGCHYCFARRYHSQFDMDAGDAFDSLILVKANIAQTLRRELDRPAWTREQVALGTATDPYQPIEGHFKLTRACLEALARARTPVGLVTKGPMVVRDTDVLLDLGRHASCTVYVSVPTVDDDGWRALEPGTAHPLQRLRAVRALVDAGVSAGVLMAPIVPGFTSSRDTLDRTLKAIADHGAHFVGCNVMYLQDGTRDHFMQFLQQEFPAMRPRFERLYRRKYPPDAYRNDLKAMVRLLQERHGLARGRDGGQSGASEVIPDAEQAAFRW